MRNVIQILILSLIGLICGSVLAVGIVSVRQAAARGECTNHVRQLALATANYADTFNGTFPGASEVEWFPRPIEPPEKRLSWLVKIVPFIEANQLYNSLSHDKPWDAEENRFAALTDYRLFHCPGYPERLPTSALVPTHYLGITGIGTDAITLPREDSRAGILGYDRKVKVEDLKRGASDTILAVETSDAFGSWTAAGPPTACGLDSDGSAYFGVGGQFGGNHRHRANAAFADGSVRFIASSIDPAVFEAMATLSGKGNRE